MKKYFYLLSFIFFLYSCAEQRPLSGGPKDTQAPRIDSSKYSTPNKQVNFRENEIILTFNEWIVLNDPLNQILVSPPLQSKPEIKLKHKSLVLKFNEELQANTTYTIQFGESVKDFTEGNPAQDLRFVFSTGPVLDSLGFGGQVVDALTAAPSDKVWVMLYDSDEDSIVYKERPLYVAKTDAQGVFRFENLKAGNFKVFALLDKNSNYKFESDEKIAFQEELLLLTDSTKAVVRLRLFEEEKDLLVQSAKLVDRNKLKVQFNKPVSDSITLKALNPSVQGFFETGKDSLIYWWKGGDDSQLNLLLTVPKQNFIDTLNIDLDSETERPVLAIVYNIPETAQGKAKGKTEEKIFNIHPVNPTEIDFNKPLQSFDERKIILLDSAVSRKIEPVKSEINPCRLIIKSNEEISSDKCIILFLPGSITDIWGDSNLDTLKRDYNVLKVKDLGNLKATVVNMDSTVNYIIRLVDDKEQILKEFFISDTSNWQKSFPLLEPKRYFIDVIHDFDGNNSYSGGNYMQKKQPETVTRSKPITVRADWDNEMEVDLNPIGKKKGK